MVNLSPDHSTRNGLAVAVREGDAHRVREILQHDRGAIDQRDTVHNMFRFLI